MNKNILNKSIYHFVGMRIISYLLLIIYEELSQAAATLIIIFPSLFFQDFFSSIPFAPPPVSLMFRFVRIYIVYQFNMYLNILFIY